MTPRTPRCQQLPLSEQHLVGSVPVPLSIDSATLGVSSNSPTWLAVRECCGAESMLHRRYNDFLPHLQLTTLWCASNCRYETDKAVSDWFAKIPPNSPIASIDVYVITAASLPGSDPFCQPKVHSRTTPFIGNT